MGSLRKVINTHTCCRRIIIHQYTYHPKNTSETEFRRKLEEIGKCSDQNANYRADGSTSTNLTSRGSAPKFLGTSVSTAFRKRKRDIKESKEASYPTRSTGKRPAFPLDPSASRRTLQKHSGCTPRQASQRGRSETATGYIHEHPLSERSSFMSSTAHDLDGRGHVRDCEKAFSNSVITEVMGSPPGSDRGSDDTGLCMRA